MTVAGQVRARSFARPGRGSGMFEPIRSTSVHRVIVGQLQQLLGAGAWKSGDRLPPERILAELLQVSRGSVREALRVLEYVGQIEARPGAGRFIAARATGNSGGARRGEV